MNELLQMLQQERFPLIMSLPANCPELARTAWENGADVVKVHINVHHHASGMLFGGFGEEQDALEQMRREARGPMGIVLGGDASSAERDFDQAVAAGFDFISLYGQNTPARVLQSVKVSKMLAPDYTWQDFEIAQLQEVGADILEGSIMHPDSYGLRLTARDLVQYRHICQVSRLPVVVPTQHAIWPEEVELLRACGIKGLMIGAVVTQKESESIGRSVRAFRRAIDEMKRKL